MTACGSEPALRTPMNEQEDMERRLNDLEAKACFAEDLLDQLNHVIVRQQQQLDQLASALADLQQHSLADDAASPRSLRDDLPPHY